jgi:hypothetical protein
MGELKLWLDIISVVIVLGGVAYSMMSSKILIEQRNKAHDESIARLTSIVEKLADSFNDAQNETMEVRGKYMAKIETLEKRFDILEARINKFKEIP